MHNYGLALDIGLKGPGGRLLDMGTPFDGFTALSEPRWEGKFLKAGKLKPEQVRSRLVLRKAMTRAGFRQNPSEWWHYDALTPGQARRYARIVE